MQALIFDLDQTIFSTENLVRDGLADLLQVVRNLGIQVAGLSADDYRVLVRLDEAGVRHLFDQVLCADQTLEPKATSGLQHLLSNLGVLPEETALVSHAHSDILLGKDAGLGSTIGVSHDVDGAAPLRLAGADYVVENIPAILDVLQ